MSGRVFVEIGAIAVSSLAGILSTLLTAKMVEQVNSRTQKEMQFSPSGWYLTKTLKLYREYGRLFPSGGLLLTLHILKALMFGSLVLCAWAIGLLRK